MTVNIGTVHKGLYQHMYEMDAKAHDACTAAGLDPLLIELVKIRVSQLNGCAFCLRMHTREALEKGESTDRLGVLAAYWESQYFSEAEVAAIRLGEHITRLQAEDQNYAPLTDEQVSAVSWLAITMNSWNRIAVHSHYPVAP